MKTTAIFKAAFAVLALTVFASSVLAQSTKVIKESLKSVVMIIAFDEEGQPTGLGSGFIINDKGDIATNYHVVEGASGVVVRLVGSEKRFPADLIVHKNAEHDLAVIRAKGLKAPALKLGDDLVQEVGGKIIAIGNPKGFSGTVSEGIISGFRKFDDKLRLMQITAPISPGSSGGPVMTEKGEVVAIATAVIRSAQNLNFAIPVSNLKELIKGKPLDLDFASKNLPSENVGLTNLKSKKADLVKVQLLRIENAETLRHKKGFDRKGGWGSNTHGSLSISIKNGTNHDISDIKLIVRFTTTSTKLIEERGVYGLHPKLSFTEYKNRQKQLELLKLDNEEIEVHSVPVILEGVVPSGLTKMFKKELKGETGWDWNWLPYATILDYEILPTSGKLEFK